MAPMLHARSFWDAEQHNPVGLRMRALVPIHRRGSGANVDMIGLVIRLWTHRLPTSRSIAHKTINLAEYRIQNQEPPRYVESNPHNQEPAPMTFG